MEKTEQTKKRRPWRAAALVVLAAVLLVGVGVPVHLAAKRNAYDAWQNDMLKNGPWEEQAAWVSKDEVFYLVCRMAEGQSMAEVTAFVERDGEWIPCKPQWPDGVKMLTFTDEDADETLFTADFDLDGAGRLKLSNVDNVAQEMEGSVILKGKCFLLDKRPYTAAEGLPVTDAA